MDNEVRTTGWSRVLEIGTWMWLALLVVLLVVIVQHLEPFLAVWALPFGIGLYLLRTGKRGGMMTIFVAGIAFTLLNLPFVAPMLLVIDAPIDFILSLWFAIAAIFVIAGGIALIRKRDGSGSDAPSKVLRTGAAALVALSAVSVVIRLVTEQPEAKPGDVSLVVQDVAFSPEELTAAGGEVAVFIDNKDLSAHTFTIDDLDVDVALASATRERVVFDAEPGTYDFYCAVQGHDDMKGTLTVE